MIKDGLTWPLVASVATHAALLSLPLAAPVVRDQALLAPALEVILLNAKKTSSHLHPAQPTALAQSSWSGGGDADRGRARSPRAQTSQPAQAALAQRMQDTLGRLEQEQQALLQLARQKAEQSHQPMHKALTEIERRIQEENARPRTRYLGPSTREVAYAEYYDRLRQQIEALGTRHFPTLNGRPLYGALTLILTVDALGRMTSIEMVQGSGNPELDRRARAIANGAAPFGEFTPEMKRQADQLAWVIRFTFSAESGLQTQWFEPTPSKR